MKIKSEVIKKKIKEKYWNCRIVADQIGITRQGMEYLLKHNSCKTITAEKICEALDLKMKDIEIDNSKRFIIDINEKLMRE